MHVCRRAASLHELAFCRVPGARGVEPKLHAAMLAGFKAPYGSIRHVPGWLHVLSCLGRAGDAAEQLPGGCVATAEKLAAELLHEAGECLRVLIIELHPVRLLGCLWPLFPSCAATTDRPQHLLLPLQRSGRFARGSALPQDHLLEVLGVFWASWLKKVCHAADDATPRRCL